MADDAQQIDRPPQKAWPAAWKIVVALVLVPILYVLSAGPSVWLFHSGLLSKPWDGILADAYYPVILAEPKLPVLAAYLAWWKPARPNKISPNPFQGTSLGRCLRARHRWNHPNKTDFQ